MEYLKLIINISTKFICIERQNSKLITVLKCIMFQSAKGENILKTIKNKIMEFREIDGDIKQIIEKRNHALGNLEFKDSNWKKYFMILRQIFLYLIIRIIDFLSSLNLWMFQD